jgi:ubiquitin-conjugating enzyme E2 D
MLRRQGTFEYVEVDSTQDQRSLRSERADEIRVSDLASDRQVHITGDHTNASFASNRRVGHCDSRSFATDRTDLEVASAGFSPPEGEAYNDDDNQKLPPTEYENQVWSLQNRRIASTYSAATLTDQAKTMAISRAPEGETVTLHIAPNAIIRPATEASPEALCDSKSLRRLMKEHAEIINTNPIDGWHQGFAKADYLDDFVIFFTGPLNSSYEGGIFHLRFKIPAGYPYKPPICQMLTKVYHPNIDARGRICVDILYDQWAMPYRISSVVVSLSSLLSDPGVDDPIVPEIAEQYIRDRAEYERIAKDYTRKYATGELPPTPDVDGKGQPWWTDVQISRD